MDSFQLLHPKWTGDTQRPIPNQQISTLQGGIPLKRGAKKSSRACCNCRIKKTKCDGREPACSSCVMHKNICSYENDDKRKKEDWKRIIDDLQEKNKALESIIESLRCHSFSEAVGHLQRLRGERSVPSQARRLSSNPTSTGDSIDFFLDQVLVSPQAGSTTLSKDPLNGLEGKP